MPLIRYCTGDLGELEITPAGTFINNLHGRIHDIVKIGDNI